MQLMITSSEDKEPSKYERKNNSNINKKWKKEENVWKHSWFQFVIIILWQKIQMINSDNFAGYLTW